MLRSQKNKDQEVYVVESYISSISYFQKQGHNFNSNKGIDALVFYIYNLLRVTFCSVNAEVLGNEWWQLNWEGQEYIRSEERVDFKV